jgi:hypothetical protein
MPARSRRFVIAASIVLLGWILLRLWAWLMPEWWWFASLSSAAGSDYLAVFRTMLGTKILVGVVVFGVLFAAAWLNIWLCHRLAPHSFHRVFLNASPVDFREMDLRAFLRRLLYGFAAAFSLLLGYSATAQWEVVQRFLHSGGIAFEDASGAPLTDPLFHRNVAYYIVRLPFLQFVNGWVLALAIPLAFIVTLIYFFYGGIFDAQDRVNVSRGVGTHLGALYACAFGALAWRHRLDMNELLFAQHEKFSGAGYVEVHARLPILWILVALALVAAAAFVIGAFIGRARYAFYVAGFYLVVVLFGTAIYPSLVSQLKVRPNEQNLQREYIGYNIQMTRAAFALDRMKEFSYDGRGELSLDDVTSPAIRHNVRLWDPRPLLEVYQQIQELRPQYDFADVDIDRYLINGTVRQVHIAAREVEASQLDPGAQNWLNRTFNYTHGYGIVASPVNEVDEGKPSFYVKNIPLDYSPDWQALIADDPGPRVYFGEKTDHYVVVNSNSEGREFDYPAEGTDFARYAYQGTGGVPVDSFFRRLAFSLRFSEFNLMLSNEITRGSRILYYRNIVDRVKRIAPFLQYDPDPYLVVADGRLVWMLDGYMTTYRFPYSRPLEDAYKQYVRETQGDAASVRVLPRGVPWGNYVRNSVKIVVDAYDGTTTFYRMNEPGVGVEDPLLECYARIFPTLFRPFAEMPATLKAHLRYPRTYFWLQATQLQAYHMTNPDTFYLQEDLWDLTYEIFDEEPHPVEPYYVTMSLPGEHNREEFLLIYPFAPRRKLVMSAWMAARCDYNPTDGPQYGEITLYRFPKGAQMFGPEQWESEFAANAEFSNWKKVQSADVRRGNLLIFPLPNGVLAVEPIYLRSQSAPIPMLRQVMAGYVTYAEESGRIRSVMGDNLDIALRRLLESATPRVTEGAGTVSASSAPTGEAMPIGIDEARATYERARSALRAEKWDEYGREMENLGRMLKRLSENASK